MRARVLGSFCLAAAVSACGNGSKSPRSGDGQAGSGGMAAGPTGVGGMAAGTGGRSEPGGAPSSSGSGVTGRAGDGGRAGASPATGGAGGTGTSGASGAARGGAGSGGVLATSGSAGTDGLGGNTAAGGAAGAAQGPLSVLVFSKTAGFRHDSIPDGIAALTKASSSAGFTMTASEDSSVFTDDGLGQLDVVVFLSTTGDILDADQQAAFERFIMSGKGFVGVHSATDTEYDWEFYGGLVGAYFREHPDVQPATLNVEDPGDVTMAGVPSPWTRTDEWYAFQSNPRPNVHVLMTLDESSYDPGTATMGDDHPITWCHEYAGGRAFYTALGHTKESYADPVFVGILTRAIEWAGGRL